MAAALGVRGFVGFTRSAAALRGFLDFTRAAARLGARVRAAGNGFFCFRRVCAVFIARGSFRAFRAAA